MRVRPNGWTYPLKIDIHYTDGSVTESQKYTNYEGEWYEIYVPENARIVGLFGRTYKNYHIRQIGFLALVES